MACDGPEGPAGPPGLNSLVSLADEPAGDHCSTGGVKITTGVDANSNATLDAAEVTETRYVCNGSPAAKEIRFSFGWVPTGTDDGGHPVTTPNVATVLNDFDLANYPGYDSIVVVLRNVTVGEYPSGNIVSDHNIVFELTNRSDDDTPIAGSVMTVTTGTDYVSGNLFRNFPSGSFDVGASLRPVDQNYSGGINPVELLLFARH